MSHYDSDDAFPQSPGLKPFKPKATPSPSPPPFIPQQTIIPDPEDVSPHSSRGRKKSSRRKTRPSQGDTVLVSFMDPNRPDIARLVGERALNSDSGSEADEEEMEDRNAEADSSDPARRPSTDVQSDDLAATARAALQVPSVTRSSPPIAAQGVKPSDKPPLAEAGVHKPDSLPNPHNAQSGQGPGGTTEATSNNVTRSEVGSVANGYVHEDTSVTSPNIRELAIPPSQGSPSHKLPALQNPNSPSRDGPTGSPNQLPSFRQLDELASSAIHEQNEARANGYPHRHSISSIGQSPTLVGRHYSTSSQRSPQSGFPLSNTTSPISANSEVSTQDPFLRSNQGFLFDRRPSQVSEPYPHTLPSASATTDSYTTSSDGLSPVSQSHSTPIENNVHRLSIDGAINTRTLPPPHGPHIQHIPPHGTGSFKCEYPGCNAAPFQTQYLLNSHANVHSQSRPHYCPVAGCPRGEGGKGFKRKNEMIRHGLVHQSPGYVCPFCPDREHKYPRPDNLQRHVRVHHVDKDKDDAQLREVLAQRPEGGSRGRRRRVGG